ncbi:adenylate/guanylate cyclase domain-containing protein [Bradyrhizobium prioriisuperbiae]|uniref:adenylate/guanylate cyclase domain-containing protein n=1 Tax=Bradyrhizobium prioriisuperbiae TaxID=2854389 RepID=UPI0028EDACE4|nr:adenylate/guanylate cyclase domain-containing protein [Bradyrhizobium prioritasuperba]
MDARLERKLRALVVIAASGIVAGIAYVMMQGTMAPVEIAIGISYGLLISLAVGVVGLFLEAGPVNLWLGGLSFTVSLLIRSAVYAAIIIPIHFFQLGVRLVGQTPVYSAEGFWSATLYSAAFLIVMNLMLGIVNIIGPRAFLNFITGRYHAPVEENRFVLFVDIAGSTGLAEQLGGIGIHRFLDRTFRLLTLSVVDHRGEVLNYIGDEVIVTWPEDSGAVDCRPCGVFLQCVRCLRMRHGSSSASSVRGHGFAAACISAR